LAAWLKTRGPQRTISPRSKVTLRQIAERERDFLPSGRESLESALKYDPTVPLARMMLANVLEKEELPTRQANATPRYSPGPRIGGGMTWTVCPRTIRSSGRGRRKSCRSCSR
jgi:hypothetical protein